MEAVLDVSNAYEVLNKNELALVVTSNTVPSNATYLALQSAAI